MDRTPQNVPIDQEPLRLRDLPAAARAVIVSVEAAMVVVVAAAVVVESRVAPAALGTATFLAALALLHTELATGIERARRRAAQNSYFDLSSVWTFAAALVLPLPLAAAVIVLAYAHLWWRVWRPAGLASHRHTYTTATVVLAAATAHLVVGGAGGLPKSPRDLAGVAAVAAAAVAYVLVNTVLVALVIGLSRPGTGSRDLIGRADDNALELATLCLGGLVAIALLNAPALVAFALPPILVLHRSVLVHQWEEVACTDAKTGLLTAGAWRLDAARALARDNAAGVMILDLDHFKAVNDEHGHLAGDKVLAAVAAAVQARVRADALVGRFGGEEFVVLVPGLSGATEGRDVLAAVADRLRRAVARLEVPVDTPDGPRIITGVTVSIGAARVPVDGTTLEAALLAADACLYAAKRGGRNLVRVAEPLRFPAPRRGGDVAIGL